MGQMTCVETDIDAFDHQPLVICASHFSMMSNRLVLVQSQFGFFLARVCVEGEAKEMEL